MAESDVKLIGGWPSPFVMRARIALNIKSVKYESLELDYHFGVKSDLLLKSNPVYKKVPVLIHIHGEKPVYESLVIVQYIDEVWSAAGHSILPWDPYDRATHCFWAAYVDHKFPTLSSIAKAQEPDPNKAEIEELIEGLVLLEEAYVKCSIEECNQVLDNMVKMDKDSLIYIAAPPARSIFRESRAHREQWMMRSKKPEEVRINWLLMTAKKV